MLELSVFHSEYTKEGHSIWFSLLIKNPLGVFFIWLQLAKLKRAARTYLLPEYTRILRIMSNLRENYKWIDEYDGKRLTPPPSGSRFIGITFDDEVSVLFLMIMMIKFKFTPNFPDGIN